MATLDVTEERRRAIDRVNRAYADEDYDRYERLIERYCQRFGFDGDYGLFEDACTDARLFGHGIGYNVGFDLGFLSAVGVRPREDARITDTMNLFTWFMGRRYKLVDAADHIGYEWTGRAHGSLADALATLAVRRWLEQWLVAE